MKLEYICRQDVLEEIDEIIGYINFTSPYQDDNDLIVRGLERARDAIECAAKADVRENVHAQWEWRDVFCEGGLMLCCSHCLETEGARENAKYCPNCGTRMDNAHER